MGMYGGGRDGFIGAIHRRAALMDSSIELVCGCFSYDAEISRMSAADYFVAQERVYATYEEMISCEAKLPEGERMDFIAIVTPNHLHFGPAKMALEAGFDVIMDKPITRSLEEALELREILYRTGRTLALTHTYTGYPAVKEMREQIAGGAIGKVRKIFVNYIQGWLHERVELIDGSNAGWRTDPSRSGKGGAMGDIGIHALNLAEYATGLKCVELCADLKATLAGRVLDDDGAALLRFDNGATGILTATQIATGEENDLSIRIYGERGGFKWRQEEPNTLIKLHPDRPAEYIRTGNGYMGFRAKCNTRTPGGHPEGFIEAFANIYRNFAATLSARIYGETVKPEWLDFPGIEEGVRGMQFIESTVESSAQGKWINWIEK